MVERKSTDIRIFKPENIQQKEESPLPSEFSLPPKSTRIIYGETVPRLQFFEENIRPPAGEELWISANENSFSVKGMIAPPKLLQRLGYQKVSFSPQEKHHVHTSPPWWSVNLGEDPNEPTQISIGKPKPILEVEFTGHPDQLLVELMNNRNDTDSQMTAVSFLDDRPENRLQTYRTVALPTSVFHTIFVNEKYNEETKHSTPFSYQGEGMFFLELASQWEKGDKNSHTRQANTIKIGLSIIGPDRKLRVYYTNETLLLPPQEKDIQDLDYLTSVVSKFTYALDHLNDFPDNETLSIPEFKYFNPLENEDVDIHDFPIEKFLLVYKLMNKNPFKSKSRRK